MAVFAWYEENMDFLEPYTVGINQLWSLVSLEVYGRDDLSWVILQANDGISLHDRLSPAPDSEYVLQIPDIDPLTFDDGNIPAWRRASNAT